MENDSSLDREHVVEFFEGDIGNFVQDTDGFYGTIHEVTPGRAAVLRYPNGTEKEVSEGYIVDKRVIRAYVFEKMRKLNDAINFFGLANEEI